MTIDQNTVWLEQRLAKTETMIVAYEDAILAIADGAQSYTLDTGQTRRTVTRAELEQLKSTLTELESRRDSIRGQLGLGYAGAQIRILPDF